MLGWFDLKQDIKISSCIQCMMIHVEGPAREQLLEIHINFVKSLYNCVFIKKILIYV